MKRVTINHWSDLHIEERGGPNFNWTKRLVEFTLEETSPDAVTLITGDVVDDGEPAQYRAALEVLEPLARNRHVIVAPGNHDYRESGTFYSAGGQARWEDFRERLTKVAWGYPYTFDLDHGVRLHVLDSCAQVDDYTSMAKGKVGLAQRLELARSLDADRHNIVALHHHPWDTGFGLKLEDAEAVLATLSGRCAALLFGHKHQWSAWSGLYGIGRIYSSGKVTGVIRDPDLGPCVDFRQVTVGEDGRVDASRVRVPLQT